MAGTPAVATVDAAECLAVCKFKAFLVCFEMGEHLCCYCFIAGRPAVATADTVRCFAVCKSKALDRANSKQSTAPVYLSSVLQPQHVVF